LEQFLSDKKPVVFITVSGTEPHDVGKQDGAVLAAQRPELGEGL
jgi:hypothetical protein